MNRKKDRENAGGAFRNTPFSGLKKIAPKTPAPRPAERPAPAPAVRQEGDDNELFQRAMAGARPMPRSGDEPGEERVRVSGPKAPAAKPSREDDEGAEQFLLAMRGLGAAALRPGPADEDDPDAEARRSASSRMRQLKKGTLRISAELDLHGFHRDEALRRLDHFLENAAALGRQAVLVITGKGINSADGPVLPSAVAERLRRQSGGLVAEFHPAPRDRGGSGAYVVFLKKR